MFQMLWEEQKSFENISLYQNYIVWLSKLRGNSNSKGLKIVDLSETYSLIKYFCLKCFKCLMVSITPFANEIKILNKKFMYIGTYLNMSFPSRKIEK